MSLVQAELSDSNSTFVAVVNRVDSGRICLASFNSTTPKNTCQALGSRRHFLYKLSYSIVIEFVFTDFVAMATKIGRRNI